MMIAVYFVQKNENKLSNNCYVLSDIAWVIEVNSDCMIWSNYISCFNKLIYHLQAYFTAYVVRHCPIEKEWIEPGITDESAVSISLIARFMGQYGAHLGPTGPRWARCWPHEPCYLGNCFNNLMRSHCTIKRQNNQSFFHTDLPDR